MHGSFLIAGSKPSNRERTAEYRDDQKHRNFKKIPGGIEATKTGKDIIMKNVHKAYHPICEHAYGKDQQQPAENLGSYARPR